MFVPIQLTAGSLLSDLKNPLPFYGVYSTALSNLLTLGLPHYFGLISLKYLSTLILNIFSVVVSLMW